MDDSFGDGQGNRRAYFKVEKTAKQKTAKDKKVKEITSARQLAAQMVNEVAEREEASYDTREGEGHYSEVYVEVEEWMHLYIFHAIEQ